MEIMDASPALKKDWVVTQASFDGLLQQLDPDRERAGERYEQIRQKLSKFFEWRGCTTPEEFADRTIDRVARRIDEGAEIHANDVYLFFHGVAVNVLREYWKDAQRTQSKPLEDAPGLRSAIENPLEAGEREGEREHKLECLDGCVHKLPAQQLTLITQYHQGEGGAKIARRNELAKQLNIPLNALRIRAYRIRSELETCISECVKRQAV
jgi:DNA-directed RNA polymerase specialized sigma24 family protein